MELTTTQKRQRLLTMIFGAVAIFLPAILTYGRSISRT